MCAAAILRLLTGLLVLSSAGLAGANADAEERMRLNEQRAQIEVQAKQALAACEQRFDVVSCQEKARGERRRALAPIEASLRDLDQQQRRERAEQQRERQAAREREAAEAVVQSASAPAVQARVGKGAEPAPLAPARRASSPPVDDAKLRASRAKAEQDAKLAAERQRQRSEQRREKLAEQRAANAKRLAEQEQRRAASGAKPPASLPVPTAAEMAALRASAAARGASPSSAPRP